MKGVPSALLDSPRTALHGAGLRLLGNDLMTPAAVLKQSALTANSAWMRAFLAHMGVELAPHGKTTMSPELIALQLADGAWGMTAATAHHVRLYAQWGVRRIIMANQLIGPANITAVLDVLTAEPELEFYCLVDDAAGVEQLAEGVRAHGLSHPVNVLIEIGAPGQRAGARTAEAALVVAKACHAHRGEVRLTGVEAFEGVFAALGEPEAAVNRMLNEMIGAAHLIDQHGLFEGEEIMVTAGGSAFFDLAAQAITSAALSRPGRLIIRSGCYLTHDNKLYSDAFERLLARTPDLQALGRFTPALEVWSHIQSRPEPTRVIGALGKRDISDDVHRPTLMWIYRPGRDTAPRPCPPGVTVAGLYDQHACIDVPAELDLAVGDLAGFGVSHPCTTFDKWKMLYVVDDDYRVVDTVTTCF